MKIDLHIIQWWQQDIDTFYYAFGNRILIFSYASWGEFFSWPKLVMSNNNKDDFINVPFLNLAVRNPHC